LAKNSGLWCFLGKAYKYYIAITLIDIMKLNVVENSKNKLKVEVEGESHTLLGVLVENSWKTGSSSASYVIEHQNSQSRH